MKISDIFGLPTFFKESGADLEQIYREGGLKFQLKFNKRKITVFFIFHQY